MNQEFPCCPWSQEPEWYEQIGAFAEVVVASGRSCAELRFSALAVHLKTCSICTTALQATLDFLNKPTTCPSGFSWEEGCSLGDIT